MADDDAMTSFHIDDPHHGTVPCSAVRAPAPRPLPVCLFLFGGGGSADTLRAIAPLLRRGFADGEIPPMVVACAGVDPLCFYVEDPTRGARWETLVADGLLAAVRARWPTRDAAGLVGISMGGFGALKIAFARPSRFSAVAAVAPMIEPSLSAADTPLRNRYHYPPGVPQALLGEARDAALFGREHPANRALAHAAAIRKHGLAIRFDAGSRDACNAHDGAELLHRLLWRLDLPHEYHLLRDADHVGPSIAPRLRAAFGFVGNHLWGALPERSAEELALADALADARRAALARDPSVARCYGLAAAQPLPVADD